MLDESGFWYWFISCIWWHHHAGVPLPLDPEEEVSIIQKEYMQTTGVRGEPCPLLHHAFSALATAPALAPCCLLLSMDLAQLQFTMDHRVTIRETIGALIVRCVPVCPLSVYQFSSICLESWCSEWGVQHLLTAHPLTNHYQYFDLDLPSHAQESFQAASVEKTPDRAAEWRVQSDIISSME
jgi:hypothetical protein